MNTEERDNLRNRVESILLKTEYIRPERANLRLINLRKGMYDCLKLLEQDYLSHEYELVEYVVSLGERTLREFFMLEYGVQPKLRCSTG
jgi:hypothetical protein